MHKFYGKREQRDYWSSERAITESEEDHWRTMSLSRAIYPPIFCTCQEKVRGISLGLPFHLLIGNWWLLLVKCKQNLETRHSHQLRGHRAWRILIVKSSARQMEIQHYIYHFIIPLGESINIAWFCCVSMK